MAEKNESSTMTAEHEGKTYVASQSLDNRLRRTEKILLLNTIAIFFLILVVVVIMFVKHDVVIGLLQRMFG